jgi:hypothetical protein
MRIVLFGANDPDRTLNLDEEARCLRESIDSGRYGHLIEINHYVAARPDDVVKYLSRDKPAVVHFSGHGSCDGITMLGEDGTPTVISGASLARVLENRGIKLVVLNCCNSQRVLDAIGSSVDAVIGTEAELDDDDARLFARAFYRALADGSTIAEAWRDGRDRVCLANGEDVFFCNGNVATALVHPTPATIHDNEDSQLRVRAAFAGGPHGSHLHLDIFNGSPSAVFISEWYAEWIQPVRRYCWAIACVRGALPKRLQDQDRCSLVVDLDRNDFEGLAAVGIRLGGGKEYAVQSADLLNLRYEAEQWRRLHPQAENSALDDALRCADVDVVAAIESDSAGKPVLVVAFTNKSHVPIPIIGATLSWSYTPPRVRPRAPETSSGIQEAAETGGQISLPCTRRPWSPVQTGETLTFAIDHHFGTLLCQLLLGDVRDDDIVIDVYTKAKTVWRAHGDEIPVTVRNFARLVMELRNSQAN